MPHGRRYARGDGGGPHRDNGRVPTSLRVLTFNIRQLRDDRSAVLEVLRAADADVVAVQEPPRGPFGARRLRSLAHEAGLDVAVVGGAARTTALLVRRGLPVGRAFGARLVSRPGRTRRGLAVADVAGVRVISTHLGLSAAERERHLVRLLLLVAGAPGPGTVVAGDLNEQPGGPTWRRLGTKLRDVTAGVGPTHPSKDPKHRIDVVLVSGSLSGVRAGTPDVADDVVRRASDHRPVLAEIAVAGAAG